jgi:hypothetical protein
MRRYSQSTLLIIVCLIAGPVSAKKKVERAWKTGQLIEAGSHGFTTTGGTTTTGSVDPRGNVNANTTAATWHHTKYTFVLDAGNKIVVGTQVLSFRWSKECEVTVGDVVQYAIEKGTLYIQPAAGKECKLDVARQTLKGR